MVVFGKDILALFGNEFLSGYYSLLILTTGVIVIATTGICAPLLQYLGHQRFTVKNFIYMLVSSIVLSSILARPFGDIGIAIAYTVPMFIFGFRLVSLLKRKHDIHVFKLS